MSGPVLDRSFGRQAFGLDAANYHAARPRYPEAVWAALRDRAGLRPGIDILEIGAGTGLATEPLLAAGPKRLVAVEPDARLAEFLRQRLDDPRLEVIAAPFEETALAPASFDLVASATAFHWLDAVPALRRIHELLRPHGAIALAWNTFGDSGRADHFHDATAHLFVGHHTSPSGAGITEAPYGLDIEARLRDLSAGGFTPDTPEILRGTLTLDPGGVRRLYATYSNITALAVDERERVLDGLAEIAEREFGGVVTRNMTTSIFTARRA
jgi:SAM-dependent methyltransferase